MSAGKGSEKTMDAAEYRVLDENEEIHVDACKVDDRVVITIDIPSRGVAFGLELGDAVQVARALAGCVQMALHTPPSDEKPAGSSIIIARH